MVETYWKKFLETGNNRQTYSDRFHTAWHFCDNKDDADKLAELVLAGTKRGTAGMVESYKAENEPLPKPGDLSIILNWTGIPQCIIETVKVWSWTFDDVPAWFAAIEGEGDGSLEYWKKVHREAFGREAVEIDIDFTDETMVVCEEFRVVCF